MSIQINIDGLLVQKSSTDCFWPIFGLLENCEDCDPFVIGLYVGMSKTTNTDEYLQRVIDDILTITRWHCVRW